MAEPRFEMVSISVAGLNGRAHSDSGWAVMWRFLSANNRSIAQSVNCFPDGDSCALAVERLKAGLKAAQVLTVRDEQGMWLWQLRLGGESVGVSSRKYRRRLHAVNSGSSFHHLAESSGEINRTRVRP
ncbi:hypothetical protein VSH64_23595 [Amycolatopsis rhabdoformis]|uniref:DUF1508 domain-containing protein n=1 Tax=Amycolatopsis rhabdoformis TaxID=1448059 RepID=A0ABZ1ILE0_9PSEU|nr:hypothetical protein [Amycolatopsis rhabdoformis]WSE35019.1 hypothetical protein VSH64_23595 [Amycolatopsis rhabdoformis]